MSESPETENRNGKRGTGVVLVLVGAGVLSGVLVVAYWTKVLSRKAGEADPSSILPMVAVKPGPGAASGGATTRPASATIPRDVADLQETFTQAVDQHRFGVAMLDAGRELVRRHPQSPDAAALNAQILLYDGQLDAARRQLQKSLELAPVQPPTLLLLGTVCMRQSDVKAAVEAYSRAVEQAPGQASYRVHLAQAHLTLGDKEKARAICREVLDRIDSGSGEALTLMADVLAEDGDFPQALANVQRAIESTPIAKRKQQVVYIRKKASLLRRWGKASQAVITLQNLMGPELADPETLQELAKAWEAAGDRKQAAAAFERALRANPTRWELASGAGRWALAAGDLFNARIYADLAQKLNPRSDEVASLLGSVLAAERAATTQPR